MPARSLPFDKRCISVLFGLKLKAVVALYLVEEQRA